MHKLWEDKTRIHNKINLLSTSDEILSEFNSLGMSLRWSNIDVAVTILAFDDIFLVEGMIGKEESMENEKKRNRRGKEEESVDEKVLTQDATLNPLRAS